MTEETLRVLEYDKITGLLARFTVTGPGRELAEGLHPLESRAEVEQSLAEAAEMARLLEDRGRPPVGGCRELREFLRQLRVEGSWLSPEALLEVRSSIEAAAACRRFFAQPDKAPLLEELAGRLDPLKELGTQIAECIGRNGEILDGASFELGEIRDGIRRGRERILRTLEGLLNSERLAAAFQEKLITERNGRYVVPVRADRRGMVKGFVHDESASGQTLFVEPAQVLEQNNRLQILRREERREEERILRRLAGAVRTAAAELMANQQLLARLDLGAAVARFALASGACGPRLCEEPVVELRGARHPLLLFHPDGTPREEAAVPVDLLLGPGRDTLVISGPNTGGKTVALKTLGLLALMVRSGLPVPCHPDSRLHLFAGVFADIGDEQSIEASLSTFSGHLTRVVRILEEADRDSLVLLDEVGTGTDPGEGGALALAVLDTLRERGARTVVTTHLNLVKGYAHLQEGVENAAVEFDRVTLAPTYRLHYGIPGASSAFTIARRLGLPDAVLERAGRYLGETEREGLDLIEELNRLRSTLTAELTAAREDRSQAERERDKRRRLLRELEEQKEAILAKAARRGEQVVRETEVRAKSLLQEAAETAGEARERARVAGAIRALREDLGKERPAPRPRGKAPHTVAEGEILYVPALGAEGMVVRRLDGEEVELDLQGKKLRLPLKSLEQFSPRRFAPRGKRRGGVSSAVARDSFSPRLLLVGKRVDEALSLLDRFLDDALLHGIREVEVVHGAGEGLLRQAVREFLAGHREVVAFHAAAAEQGGDKVTVAELRG